MRWNHDKRYLTELGALPVVPTRLASDREGFASALAEFGTAVVKPRIGASGAGRIVVDGEPSVQVDKLPGAGEVRVHEEFGGSSRPAALDPACASLAVEAMAAASERCGRPLDYGRVDMMWLGGRWVVGEIELIEPGLYLDVTDGAAVPFADLVVRRLG